MPPAARGQLRMPPLTPVAFCGLIPFGFWVGFVCFSIFWGFIAFGAPEKNMRGIFFDLLPQSLRDGRGRRFKKHTPHILLRFRPWLRFYFWGLIAISGFGENIGYTFAFARNALCKSIPNILPSSFGCFSTFLVFYSFWCSGEEYEGYVF